MRDVRRFGCATVGLLAFTACGNESQDGHPRIEWVEYFQQVPTEPLNLEFGLRFVDSDGDAGGGRLELTLDGVRQPGLDASELFAGQEPPLDVGATEGILEVELRLSGEPRPGQRVEVGFQLVDAAERPSNAPTLVLEVVGPGGN